MSDHFDLEDHHAGQTYRRDADEGREPQLVAGRAGTRLYSLAALQERIEEQFIDEHGERSPALEEAVTRVSRLQLILETVDYVLNVESVVLPAELKAQLVERVYANLFGYSILDALLTDPEVTTIAIHGAAYIAVRRGHGGLVRTELMFEDDAHLRRVLGRLLADAGAELREDEPIVETGLTVLGRRASLTVAIPPVSPYIHVDMRLHPAEAPTLESLIAAGWMTDDAAALLRSIVASRFGFMIVGEPESGKTTLLSALLGLMPGEGMLAVERSGELRLPEGASSLQPRWQTTRGAGLSFGMQIESGLAGAEQTLVLDEVRSDEPLTILPLLTGESAPRQIWAVRGTPDAKKLQSSIGMLARRADMAHSEQMVAALYDRLPFIITVRNIRERLQIFSVAEWQSRADSDYPDYVMLLQYQDGAARPTGAQLARWLA